MVLIGKKIKELRNKSKLTQSELAEKIGVTKSTIAAYENDSRQPSYEVLIRMASVFRVSVDSLLLDRSEVVLEVRGLTEEQIDILGLQISYFKKINRLRNIYEKTVPDTMDIAKEYSDVKIDE